jgi:hypothetical protein
MPGIHQAPRISRPLPSRYYTPRRIKLYGAQSTESGGSGDGYSVTPFGRRWLAEADNATFVPTEPERFAQMLAPTAFEGAGQALELGAGRDRHRVCRRPAAWHGARCAASTRAGEQGRFAACGLGSMSGSRPECRGATQQVNVKPPAGIEPATCCLENNSERRFSRCCRRRHKPHFHPLRVGRRPMTTDYESSETLIEPDGTSANLRFEAIFKTQAEPVYPVRFGQIGNIVETFQSRFESYVSWARPRFGGNGRAESTRSAAVLANRTVGHAPRRGTERLELFWPRSRRISARVQGACRS